MLDDVEEYVHLKAPYVAFRNTWDMEVFRHKIESQQ